MPRELINAEITHVSYVDRAASRKKFFLTKAEGAQQEMTAAEVARHIQQQIKPMMERMDSIEKAEIQKSLWSNLFVTDAYRLK